MSAEWSSSMTVTRVPPGTLSSTFASRRARSADIDTPVGFCARGCSSTAEGPSARARARDAGTTPSASVSSITGTAPAASIRSKK